MYWLGQGDMVILEPCLVQGFEILPCLFRGIQHQTVQELEKQVELLRDRDAQLQYTVKEQEAKIEALKQKVKNTGDKVVYLSAAHLLSWSTCILFQCFVFFVFVMMHRKWQLGVRFLSSHAVYMTPHQLHLACVHIFILPPRREFFIW